MAYTRAVRMMRSTAVKAFDLDREDPRLRDAYGRNPFGQGCLLARRLVERGVPFVEVTLAGVTGPAAGASAGTRTSRTSTPSSRLSGGARPRLVDFDAGPPGPRGLLDSTLIVWMGEFGRTPKINPQSGRDHFPNAWTTVLAGGGIKGGQAFGRTEPPTARRSRNTRSPCPTSSPRSARPSASIRSSRTCPTSAGRSGSSTRRPSRSRRCWHEAAGRWLTLVALGARLRRHSPRSHLRRDVPAPSSRRANRKPAAAAARDDVLDLIFAVVTDARPGLHPAPHPGRRQGLRDASWLDAIRPGSINTWMPTAGRPALRSRMAKASGSWLQQRLARPQFAAFEWRGGRRQEDGRAGSRLPLPARNTDEVSHRRRPGQFPSPLVGPVPAPDHGPDPSRTPARRTVFKRPRS